MLQSSQDGGPNPLGGGFTPHGLPASNDAGNTAAGGSSMADFSSLMNLVQTTIEPDSWEALGGVGTMAPYPQGVMVDPDGLLHEIDSQHASQSDHEAAIASLLAPPAADGDEQLLNSTDWRAPARIRCVSIRRMMQALAGRQIANQSSANDLRAEGTGDGDDSLDAFRAMAGLSRVAVVMVTQDDVILAGPVGGFDDVDGWQVDRKSGLPPLSLVSLAIGVKAVRSSTPYGCTIDPTTAGLQSAAALGQRIASGEVPMARAADQLASALGRQNVSVFGTTGSNEIAYTMVEADRHMKRLALGTEPLPDRVRNYLQMLASTGDGTPPTDLLLRLWFTSRPLDVRASEADGDQIIQIAGTPIRLSGENERAQRDGARGQVVIDPASLAFVDHFNQNWASIRGKYPLYGALESIYLATAISELWKRSAMTSDHETLQRAVMYFAAQQAPALTPARQVDSIAVLHRYQRGRKKHQVLMASGGVQIAPQELVPLQMEDYPGLQSFATIREGRPSDRWWWNGTLNRK
ncbi:DUF1598 domain-containing protein [Allorhodopirellula solitaria]|uniref:DUF1598 domain-containing protein n=1 Tax=Allorhodopirellula solitaria TaxID=2527987 RepID=UPI001FECF1A5|nr:DUF1598 domain-containing protein [Allorhodopirellula solitaria]